MVEPRLVVPVVVGSSPIIHPSIQRMKSLAGAITCRIDGIDGSLLKFRVMRGGKGQCFPVFEWLGRQPYRWMWQRMLSRAQEIADHQAGEIIWTCEHDPVYTTGRRGVNNRLGGGLAAPFIGSDRGGETTFHGPGQLLFYPVISLRGRGLGVKQYVHILERSCINMLDDLDIQSTQRSGFPGVWTERGKIAALGLHVTKGVVYHGMALNVSVEPHWFAAINPCGISAPAVNLSLFRVPPSLADLAEAWHVCFRL